MNNDRSVSIDCKQCGVNVPTYKSRLGRKKFCSRKCMTDFHNLFVEVPAIQRVMDKVEKTNDCWLYNGNLNPFGYGRVKSGGGDVMVHRVSYEHFVSKLPKGLEIDHLCSVRNCVNPEHLEAVTHKVNVWRGKVTKNLKLKEKAYANAK